MRGRKIRAAAGAGRGQRPAARALRATVQRPPPTGRDQLLGLNCRQLYFSNIDCFQTLPPCFTLRAFRPC